eukprot:PhF_6_TR40222/c0_g2_i2/m.59767
MSLYVSVLLVSTLVVSSWGWEHMKMDVCRVASSAKSSAAPSPSVTLAPHTQCTEGQHSVLATVDYNTTLMEIGWDTLTITTNGQQPDMDQAYSAGYAEGVLTAQRICDNWHNFQSVFGSNGTIPSPIAQFLKSNYDWAKSQASKATTGESGLWHQVGLLLQQFDGMLDGFTAQPNRTCSLGFTELYYFVSLMDVMDIAKVVGVNMPSQPHCSVLIKATADLSDIYFGHVTWSEYIMMRIYKTYVFNYKDTTTASTTVAFSSSPALLTSIDDFHITNTGIMSTETTLSTLTESIYNNTIFPQSLLYWHRTAIANRMATSAPHWYDIFSQYNSGTYMNQWMILDLSRFTPGKDIQNDTLWVIEQIPGQVVGKDQSMALAYGYWPSYNVPLYPTVAAALGYPTTQDPGMNDYQRCARANIFRRDQSKVTDLASMVNMMEYNQYKTDPFSNGHPLYAISSRGDFEHKPKCFGGIDSKVSSYSMWKQGGMVSVRSGPTHQQGVFSLEGSPCPKFRGVPTVYNFSRVMMQFP